MIKNYLVVAWRNLMKNKIFSFINIFGLSIGLTCCMLITMYLFHEFSYDRHHREAAHIYQLGTIFVKDGKEDRTANTPSPMARAMQNEFPEIENTARLMRLFSDDKTLLQYNESGKELKSFYETRGYLADSTFFQLFTYRFKEGNPATALLDPSGIVISEEIATKLFGNTRALDKIIRVSSSTNGDGDYKVTGVFIPSNKPSHIDARFFMSMTSGEMASFVNTRTELASNNMFYTYLKLKQGSDPKKLESKFPAFIDKHAGKDLKALGFYKKQFLTQLPNVHLYSNTSSNVTPGGSVTYLYILASIAIFTLLIACINFMNLSTARSSRRSAEVGVRKVLGAQKRSLIWQFIGESLLMAVIAFAIAFLFAQLLLPIFREISGKELAFNFREHGVLLACFFLLAIITGLIAGSYPAFYLSSFIPVRVLKGKISNSLAAISLRKGLVVFQFTISIVLIVASVVINNQMQYLRSKDLGFTKEQQIIIPLRSATAKNIYNSLKTELQRNPKIESVGATLYYPGIMNPNDMPLYKEGLTVDASKRVFFNRVDETLIQTLNIKPVAGRLFSPQFPADTNFRMVLNEQAIKQMGFASPQEAVGKFALFDWQGETYRLEIVGVVKDFHFQALHVPIEPFGFQRTPFNTFNYLIARAAPGDISSTLKSVEASWKNLNPNEPFEFTFLDEDFQKNYEAENRLSVIVKYFTIIAILISCLGLFGLATFSAEQRTKEIGVRKVLGAGVANIVALLSKDFLKLVAIALVIATPIAWYAMNKWLEDFAYRTNISWVVFGITAAVAFGIALITISFQAIRAGVANPVKSLRSE